MNEPESETPQPTGYVTQRLVPSPGRMVVVRERAKAQTYGGLFKPDEAVDWESRANPFALVVGVGDAQVTQYGTVIETDCREGDKVVIGALGIPVELVSDGKLDYVYVVGFESVVGRLELVCGACGHHERNFAHEAKCPKCGAGVAPELAPEAPMEIVVPTGEEAEIILREQITFEGNKRRVDVVTNRGRKTHYEDRKAKP